MKKMKSEKNESPGGGHFDYRWKAENLIRWSPYSWVTSREKLEGYNNYFSSYRVNKNFFKSLTLIFVLWPWPWVKKVPRGVECLYEWWIQTVANEMKWNEWGFRPPLCTYRLNWATVHTDHFEVLYGMVHQMCKQNIITKLRWIGISHGIM